MSKSTISTFELFAMFPDQEAARAYLEGRLWPNGPRCPVCGLGERITPRKGGFYRCNQCKEDFTVRTGTVFERSHIPLNAWIVALGIVAQSPEVSSAALAHGLGITQKSAWFVLQRLREANKHANKKLRAGRGAVGKTPVLGMKERGGRVKAMPIADDRPDGFIVNVAGKRLTYKALIS